MLIMDVLYILALVRIFAYTKTDFNANFLFWFGIVVIIYANIYTLFVSKLYQKSMKAGMDLGRKIAEERKKRKTLRKNSDDKND